MNRSLARLILTLAVLVLPVTAAIAQLLTSPVNMGIGGGGTASTTGHSSLFVNPANLLIQEREYNVQINALSFGIHFNSPVSYRDTGDYFPVWYLNQTRGFSPDSPESVGNHSDLLERNYRNGKLTSEHFTKGDLLWFGIHWTRPDKGFAIAMRSRFSSRYVVGRNYYDSDPVETESHFEFNRSLTHQYQSFHEISFGYAETFTYINGLIPQLSRIIIGVAPKLVLAGAFSDMAFENVSRAESSSGLYSNKTGYKFASSGPFTSSMPYGFGPADASGEWSSPARRTLFNPAGFGFGLDFGLTYLITLGDDLSALTGSDATTQKSLRVSFSVTDIGWVRYSDRPYQSSWSRVTRELSPVSNPSELLFTGRPGEHFYFLEQSGTQPQEAVSTEIEEPFSALLPTTLHAGTLFHLNRVKLSGDISLGLTNNAFNTTKFITHLGTEVRILPFLPLRAGTRLAINLPGYYSFGGGIETDSFDLNLAFQLRSKSSGLTSELSGAAMGALTVYIQ